MNLIKDKWKKQDGINFNEYLETLINRDKIDWTRNIVNTNMKVLAIKSTTIKSIAKEIKKGNYESFLDLMLWKYFENTLINGALLTQIKDFNKLNKYLDIYSSKADNWATCDTLSFNIKGNEENFLLLSKKYIKSNKPFVRRIGIVVLFNFIKNDTYLKDIFEILNTFYNEDNYYVNMINAWLVCECFIKKRDATLKYLDNHKLNKFTINKAICKCRDSYRISIQDKEMLLKYKIK